MMLVRIFANVALLFAVFLLPWWACALLALACVFYFSSFYEVLVWAIVMDALYAVPQHTFGITFLLYASVVFLISFPIKKRLKFYDMA